MKHSSDLIVDADAPTVIATLADLSTYPEWNDLVSAAVPTEPIADDVGPAWSTTLRAQVGPFARSKQLRFVRDDRDGQGEDENSARVRFVRNEDDGRDHAAWTMEVEVDDAGPRAVVTLTLEYDGGLWVPVLGTILGSAIERSTARLPAYIESRAS